MEEVYLFKIIMQSLSQIATFIKIQLIIRKLLFNNLAKSYKKVVDYLQKILK